MSTAYDISAIKDKINQFNNSGKESSGGNSAKFNFYKPELGDNYVRFLPIQTSNNMPFLEVAYYTSKLLVGSGFRKVAPYQFGLEDPIWDFISKLSQSFQEKEVFKFMKAISPKESYYGAVYVRGQEDKGVQLYEMTFNRAMKVYKQLAHPDYEDEDLFDPVKGRDFIISATETDRIFNGNVVKDYEIQVRGKSTKLAEKAADREEILNSIPDFEAYFKGLVRDPEFYANMLENAIQGGEVANKLSAEGTNHTEQSGATTSAKESEEERKLNEAFSDLDDDIF